MFENFLEKSPENGPWAEKWQDRKSKKAENKNKNKTIEDWDRKENSNNSPETANRGGASDITRPPFGVTHEDLAIA